MTTVPPDPDLVESEAWAQGYLVPPDELARVLGTPVEDTVAREAVALASTFVRAYCTRLRPSDPVPLTVRAVALQLALRIARNPTALRTAGIEGQSVAYPPVGLTFFESLLLARWRRRAA